MDKEQAKLEIVRLNKLAEAISPEFLRLQKMLTIISDKIQYCEGIVEGKPVMTSEEAIVDAEKEFVEPVEAVAPAQPEPAPLTNPEVK